MLKSNQARIHTFDVVPSLPAPLEPLMDIAYNLWWSWHPEAVELFVRLDRHAWDASGHNPVHMLGHLSQEVLDDAAKDDGFLTSIQRVLNNLQRHFDRRPWLERHRHVKTDFTIAYFCTEFGITSCLPIYSGGLGCLAGDHLKSASELGMPLVGVGLLYRNGYFQQYLNADGWQQEFNPELDFTNLPVSRAIHPDGPHKGQPVRVSVNMLGRDVHIDLWKAIVGRIPLYLLDTNVPENDPEHRNITSQLYGGDMEMRIRQEIVLGIGGVRALKAMGIEPDVCHMNEGHSAFLALERIATLIEKHHVSFDEAREQAAASHVFTTHTPVPAGIDRFPPEMIARYFKDFTPRLKLDMEGLLALGRENVYEKREFFSMAVLAIRTANWANGVSRLHGVVSRKMWQPIWPAVPENEIPIGHVTNGVHARSWLSRDMIYLLDRYMGHRWQNDPSDHEVWKSVHDIPDEEVWRVHERRRHSMILWAREKMRKQLEARGVSSEEIQETVDSLDPNALTIGFARRFATYKRGTLLFRDAQRLMKLLGDADRPLQFLIAGKSHPADGGGKDLIRQIVQFARESNITHKIVFLENYDIHVAQYLVQGCDVWLNNPRRGMEASGTSGMKAALNGVLNCSIMDGWWDEAYESDVGWSIGRGEDYANPEQADDIESRAMLDLFEKQIVPLFYDRDALGVPRRWVSKMKQCIARLAPVYNTNRMVAEYADKFYVPALLAGRQLAQDHLKAAVALHQQKSRLRHLWHQVAIDQVTTGAGDTVKVNQTLSVQARVRLGELNPAEVNVELYIGTMDNDGRLGMDAKVVRMTNGQSPEGGVHTYRVDYTPTSSGRVGFSVRVRPAGAFLDDQVIPGLILWDQPKPDTATRSTPV